MSTSIHLVCGGAAILCLAGSVWAADEPAPGARAMHHAATAKSAKPPPTDEELIASAMKAAPKDVADKATIVAPDPKGAMRTLRKGTNGFTCMPDNPETPGPDPMCWDKNSGDWIDAYLNHKTPPAGKMGLMYMLAGGTDASNTDPYAAKPTAANHWIKTGPHIMIVGADASFYDTYPKGADPDTKSPYVMWAGTPYQHLMAPIH
ncbi:MAG TPA: hypothetical protein VEU94_14360 [Terriglobales bacterium]|nr:hypothetical protein [Terriglobales bacterium]